MIYFLPEDLVISRGRSPSEINWIWEENKSWYATRSCVINVLLYRTVYVYGNRRWRACVQGPVERREWGGMGNKSLLVTIHLLYGVRYHGHTFVYRTPYNQCMHAIVLCTTVRPPHSELSSTVNAIIRCQRLLPQWWKCKTLNPRLPKWCILYFKMCFRESGTSSKHPQVTLWEQASIDKIIH